MLNRRDLYRWGTVALANAMALAVAIPGVKFLLDPLGKRSAAGEYRPLARLSQLVAGEPQAFAVIARRQDAWVRYPPEPIGSVWLIRHDDGATPSVVALSAECPHLSCPVNLAPDRKTFLCPCHQASFGLDGSTLNAVSPRRMDELDVRLSKDDDPEVAVKFERYQPQTREKRPLV